MCELGYRAKEGTLKIKIGIPVSNSTVCRGRRIKVAIGTIVIFNLENLTDEDYCRIAIQHMCCIADYK